MPDTPKRQLAAIILAAGGSTRFGKPKQLHPYDGKPLVRRAVTAALDAGADEIIVVLGFDADSIMEAVNGIPELHTVINKDWETGLASSIKAGLSAINEADGILITLADQPLIDSNALQKLIDRFDDTHRIIASSYADTIGVPAIVGSEFIDELLSLTGDHGAGSWIRSRIADVTIVPLEAAAIDVDTPADAARLEEL